MRFLLICAGGAVGTGARYLLSGWALAPVGRISAFARHISATDLSRLFPACLPRAALLRGLHQRAVLRREAMKALVILFAEFVVLVGLMIGLPLYLWLIAPMGAAFPR